MINAPKTTTIAPIIVVLVIFSCSLRKTEVNKIAIKGLEPPISGPTTDTFPIPKPLKLNNHAILVHNPARINQRLLLFTEIFRIFPETIK